MKLSFCKFRSWFIGLALLLVVIPNLNAQQRWSEAHANGWYAQQPWPVGANFLPSTAINQLEMWQAESFDAATIDRELGWAEGIGMNTMRVFLHNLVWEQDAKGYEHRIDVFLAIAAHHHIRPVFVLFDSCWDPHPKLGIQHPPIPGVHNSGWVQAPGTEILQDPAQYPRLEHYVKGVVGAFANDPRILAWDLCNEPYSYSLPREKMPGGIVEAESAWLKGLYDKCKQLGATAPITVGNPPGLPLDVTNPMSDLLSIHAYWLPGTKKAPFEKKLDVDVAFAQKVKKPLLSSECCWGSLDDAVRAEIVRYTLTELKKRNIGWLPYLLHHSLTADSHGRGFGPVGFPENLAFIQPDGSLRPGHDVFNEF